MMITCKQACNRATDYIEGPTGFWQRLVLRMHLVICKHCRRFYRQFRMTIGATPHLYREAVPTDAEIDALARRLAGQ